MLNNDNLPLATWVAPKIGGKNCENSRSADKRMDR